MRRLLGRFSESSPGLMEDGFKGFSVGCVLVPNLTFNPLTYNMFFPVDSSLFGVHDEA
jgi:hypothetical protein